MPFNVALAVIFDLKMFRGDHIQLGMSFLVSLLIPLILGDYSLNLGLLKTITGTFVFANIFVKLALGDPIHNLPCYFFKR